MLTQSSRHLLTKLQEMHLQQQEADRVLLLYCLRRWLHSSRLCREDRQARMRRHITLAKVGSWLAEVQQRRRMQEEQIREITEGTKSPTGGEENALASFTMSSSRKPEVAEPEVANGRPSSALAALAARRAASRQVTSS